jgi:hypothetical protein
MSTSRYNHTATPVPNGAVLAAGGDDDSLSGGGPAVSSAEIYNPTSGTWSLTGIMSTARYAHTATLTPQPPHHPAREPGRPKPDLKYKPARVQLYERNLTSMLDFADRNGVRVALFLQPLMWIDGHRPTTEESRVAAPDSDSMPVRRAFYAEARPMLTRLRERYQRPERVCIEDLSQNFKDTTETTYGDSGHLFGPGNQIIADEIVKQLAVCGVLGN